MTEKLLFKKVYCIATNSRTEQVQVEQRRSLFESDLFGLTKLSKLYLPQLSSKYQTPILNSKYYEDSQIKEKQLGYLKCFLPFSFSIKN